MNKEIIFHENEEVDEIYFVMKGEVRLLLNNVFSI